MAGRMAPAVALTGRLVGLPLWAAPIGASLTYVLLALLVPPTLDPVEARAASNCAPLVAADMGLVGLAGWYEGRRRLARRPELLRLWRMGEGEFVQLVADAYRERGFAVWESRDCSQDTAAARGVDLELSRGGRRLLVQTTGRRAHEVELGLVRRLWEEVTAEQAQGGIVVTCGRFSPAAEAYAHSRSLQLVDGQRLLELLDLLPWKPEEADEDLRHSELEPAGLLGRDPEQVREGSADG